MKTNIIPAGYRLTVNTWENDGDNNQTKVIDGLSLDAASFYADVCKKFAHDAGNYHERIFNLYDPSEDEITRVQEYAHDVFARFPSMLQELGEPDASDDDGDDLESALFEFLCRAGIAGQGEFFTRTVESWTMEYLPRSIHIEDVTDQF